MIELQLFAVLYSLLSRHRVVLLKRSEGDQYLPIWIGTYESDAIATRLQGSTVPRPLTHDLLASVIGEMGGEVRYVLINDLSDSTFFARIAIDQGGQVKLVDSRPSDAIALAVRVSVPIYAEEKVLEKAGIGVAPEVRANIPADDQLNVFRDFVDTLNLDDLEDR